jgi:hypothetical protein
MTSSQTQSLLMSTILAFLDPDRTPFFCQKMRSRVYHENAKSQSLLNGQIGS